MYSHSRSFAPHQGSYPNSSSFLSHHSHPSASYHRAAPGSSSSHHHVLQNPPQSTATSTFPSQSASSSSPSRSHYQPFYPNIVSINANEQDAWNGGNSSGGGGGNASGSTNGHDGPHQQGGMTATGSRTNVSHAASGTSPVSRLRAMNTASRSDNSLHNANFRAKQNVQDARPAPPKPKSIPPTTSGTESVNWGLIGRQLSQIAGDVSTSVRQNELVISLLERLVERVESAPVTALQADYSLRGPAEAQGQPTAVEDDIQSHTRSTVRRNHQNFGTGEENASVNHVAHHHSAASHHNHDHDHDHHHNETHNHHSSHGRNVMDPPTSLIDAGQHTQGEASNVGAHAQVGYLDDGLGSQSFEFASHSQSLNARNQYSAPVSSFDGDMRGKKTAPRSTYLLSGGHDTSQSSANPDSAPAFADTAGVTTRQQNHHHHQQQQQQHHHHAPQHHQPQSQQLASHHSHSHNDTAATGNGAAEEENYNRIPSPVFSDTAPADEEPPPALGFGPYYSPEDAEPSRPDLVNRRSHMSPSRHVMEVTDQTQAALPPSASRHRETSHLNVLQSASLGLLEDAGLIPVSSATSTSVTPAPRHVTVAEESSIGGGEGLGDQSFASTTAAKRGDEEEEPAEPANDDWKLWMEPRQQSAAVLRNVPRAKYQSAKQVKQERKEKTKRSMSTIGRIPLKEYLEVGEDYKAVRRTARSVYNTWLILNVRLAKQDSDRLTACYHKLEHDFPILADCEDHWKAKELMLQVIDNAIDEIAFHRRKEERRTKQIQERRERMTAMDLDPRTGVRRDAIAADLYTSEDTRPATRRRRNATTVGDVSNNRGQSDEEVDVAIFSHNQPHGPHAAGNPTTTEAAHFTAFDPNLATSRPAHTHQQQNHDQRQDWTHTGGDEANLFAQAQAFTQSQQPPPTTRTSSRRHAQIHSHGW